MILSRRVRFSLRKISNFFTLTLILFLPNPSVSNIIKPIFPLINMSNKLSVQIQLCSSTFATSKKFKINILCVLIASLLMSKPLQFNLSMNRSRESPLSLIQSTTTATFPLKNNQTSIKLLYKSPSLLNQSPSCSPLIVTSSASVVLPSMVSTSIQSSTANSLSSLANTWK